MNLRFLMRLIVLEALNIYKFFEHFLFLEFKEQISMLTYFEKQMELLFN